MARITALASLLAEETPVAQEALATDLTIVNGLVEQGSYAGAATLMPAVEELLYRLRVYTELTSLLQASENASEEQRIAMVLDRIGVLSMVAGPPSAVLSRILSTIAAS